MTDSFVPKAWSAEAHEARFMIYFDARREDWLQQPKFDKYCMIMDILWYLKSTYGTQTQETARQAFPVVSSAYPSLVLSTYLSYMNKYDFSFDDENGVQMCQLNKYVTIKKKMQVDGNTVFTKVRVKKVVLPFERTFEWLYDKHTSGPNGTCQTKVHLEKEIENSQVIIGDDVIKEFQKGCFICHKSEWNAFRADHPQEAAVMEPPSNKYKKGGLLNAVYPAHSLQWRLRKDAPTLADYKESASLEQMEWPSSDCQKTPTTNPSGSSSSSSSRSSTSQLQLSVGKDSSILASATTCADTTGALKPDAVVAPTTHVVDPVVAAAFIADIFPTPTHQRTSNLVKPTIEEGRAELQSMFDRGEHSIVQLPRKLKKSQDDASSSSSSSRASVSNKPGLSSIFLLPLLLTCIIRR